MRTFLSIIAPFIILILAYSIDYAYLKIAEDAGRSLRYQPHWLEYIAMNSLFVLGIFLYIWFVVSAPEAQPGIVIGGFTLTLFVFLYRYFAPSPAPLSLPPFLRMLHSSRLFLSPRTFLVTTTLIIAIGSSLTLWRYVRQKITAINLT